MSGKTADNNLHEGHRKRMWEKYRNNGTGVFEDHELLEMLLYIFLPRVNTNETAHQLIRDFQSLSGVLKADEKSLADSAGIGSTTALRLRFIGDLYDHISRQSVPLFSFRKSSDVIKYCMERFKNMNTECMSYFLMNDELNVMYHSDILSKNENSVEFNVKDMIRKAVRYDCSKIILAHNHPTGSLLPSNSDIMATRRLSELLRAIDIEIIDHLIVNENGVKSMMQYGELMF